MSGRPVLDLLLACSEVQLVSISEAMAEICPGEGITLLTLHLLLEKSQKPHFENMWEGLL